MIVDNEMVSATELAYIADVSDREVNRLVDEHILPDFLFNTDRGRRFDRSVAALARFYFEAQEILTANTRKFVVREMSRRIKDSAELYCFDESNLVTVECKTYREPYGAQLDLSVDCQFTKIDMKPFFAAVSERASGAARASQVIVSDPSILGGEPVFAGSRVPIDTVIGSLDEGMALEDLKESWSFLTEELIEGARLYQKLHPRRGRPRRSNEGWKLVSREVIHPKAGNE